MADKKISALTVATTPLAGTEVLPIVQSGSTVKVANNDLRPKQIQSNATSGVLQIAGPAAAATRVMTTPDANFTAARTDDAQTFNGIQTFSNTDTNYVKITHATRGGDYRIQTSGVSSENLAIKTGTNDIVYFGNDQNVKIATAGKGIDFSANTHAAGMTSELLNWYEEGTFTPTFTSTGATWSYTTQYGTYTRVGRLVMAQFYLRATASGTTSNQVNIASLPFVSANINGVVQCAGNSWFSGPKSIALLQQNNASTIQIWQNGTTSTLTAADVSTYYLVGSIVYQAA